MNANKSEDLRQSIEKDIKKEVIVIASITGDDEEINDTLELLSYFVPLNSGTERTIASDMVQRGVHLDDTKKVLKWLKELV
jgi:hypothetical protein